MNTAKKLTAASENLAAKCASLRFSPPITHTYHPLLYARDSHRLYLQKFGNSPKRVLFVGMNPGPWGMAQTGVPFGEIAAVRDWMKISAPVNSPPNIHPSRPVSGFACARSEASGRRLWGMFAARFRRAEDFFAAHFVLNYCPVLFLAADEKRCTNITPDKLPAAESAPLFAACDDFLRTATNILRPQFCIGIGNFAESRLHSLFANSEKIRVCKILHPSPASPAANKNFTAKAEQQLITAGVWKS